jgi:dephospho-CoA kinase
MQSFKKIVVCGPQGQGKITFINDFLKEFPSFKTPEITYRDIVEKQKLKLNRICDKYSQKILTDFNYNQIVSLYNSDMIFDRCVIDNLIYTTWSYLHKADDNDIDVEFINYTKNLVDKTYEYINTIIFIPLVDNYVIPLIDDGVRDISTEYVTEIDNLFKQFFNNKHYNNVIHVSGTRINRIEQIKKLFTE